VDCNRSGNGGWLRRLVRQHRSQNINPPITPLNKAVNTTNINGNSSRQTIVSKMRSHKANRTHIHKKTLNINKPTEKPKMTYSGHSPNVGDNLKW
jgi:hypothetical protein